MDPVTCKNPSLWVKVVRDEYSGAKRVSVRAWGVHVHTMANCPTAADRRSSAQARGVDFALDGEY
jgi:hypothetical protein